MAKGRGGRGPSRMDLRRQGEAAEARERDETEEIEDEESEEEEDEESDGEAVDGEEVEEEVIETEDGEEIIPVKKAKKKAAVKKPAAAKPKRTKAVKIVRQKAVWKVLDNGGKIVGVFAFNERAQAEEHLAAKIAEKEGKTTFYIQLVKEALEE